MKDVDSREGYACVDTRDGNSAFLLSFTGTLKLVYKIRPFFFYSHIVTANVQISLPNPELTPECLTPLFNHLLNISAWLSKRNPVFNMCETKLLVFQFQQIVTLLLSPWSHP